MVKPARRASGLIAGDNDRGLRAAILMRTRDRPVLLARALASVLSQRQRDWHLFLVNDGGDPAAVDTLLLRHETGFEGRVSVLHHEESLGRQAAGNAALRLASAMGGFAFLALHDDDDTWHPDFLARAGDWLSRRENNGFVAVTSWWRIVHEHLDGDVVIEDRVEDAPFDMPVLDLATMLGRNRMPIGTVLFRRDAVDAAGPFDSGMPVLEDWDFLLRVLAQGDIGVLPERLAFYHHRDVDTLPAYRNSAQEMALSHEIQFIRYRNERLRALVDRDPGALALLGALGMGAERYHEQAELQHGRILANLDRNGLWGHARHEDLQQRLIRVEQMLVELGARVAVPPAVPPVTSAATPHAVVPPRPVWKRLARGMAGPLIDRVRRRSA